MRYLARINETFYLNAWGFSLYFFLIFLLFYSSLSLANSSSHTDELSKKYCFITIEKKTFNAFNRREEIYCSQPNETEATDHYKKYSSAANPFIPYPAVVINDQLLSNENKTIYNVRYHTEKFGLRRTPNSNTHSHQHLIISGDSNIFGIGVADDKTLPNRLAQSIPNYAVYNLGLTATGPSSALYFLQQFGLKDIIPSDQRTGIFIYDFHHYLIERVIGSKEFLRWGIFQARYGLKNNKVEYLGPFNHHWLSLFYKFLNYLPFNQKLFPNLPRISREHLYLTAKLFAEMKNEYLKQTNAQNRFIITINPKYINPNNSKDVDTFVQFLKREKIEVIQFKTEEILDLPAFDDGHLNEAGLQNYSQMMARKLL
jgi:hypothetical protein